MAEQMAEFASGVLVAAVQRALAAEGIAVTVPKPVGALVPLSTKRRMLADVARTHGLLPLLRAGQSISSLPPDPAVSALTAAGTPAELFARWSRLERFVHSRHRVVVRETSPTHLVAEHVGTASRPEPAEDALVLGVLVALLSMIGARGVVFDDRAFTDPEPGHRTGLWRFTWSSLTPKTPVVTGSDTASQARHLFTGDLPGNWTLPGLAAQLDVSPRTLQRRLRPDGGFSTVLAAARAEAAADLLMNTQHPIGVVGFACGYTDQPHLTREFKRRTAMTPAAYRSEFGNEARA